MSRLCIVLRRVALVVGLTCLASVVPVFSQGRSAPYERFFALDWHVERRDGQDVAVVGYLRNDYLYALRRIELRLQVFDDAGRVTSDVYGSIDRDVPPGTSVTFRVPLRDAGARYAVLVHTFEFGERQSP